MLDELRPRVAALLREEHHPDPTAAAGLAADDSAELLGIAAGATHPEYRVKALSALARTDTADATAVFRDAVTDRGADDTVRAAGAAWLSRAAAPDADSTLVAALAVEPSAAVRHKLYTALARVGTADTLPALDEAVQNASADEQEHVAYARTVVAARAGVDGFAVPPVPDAELLPVPADATTTALVEEPPGGMGAELVDRLRDDRFGLVPDPSRVTALRCQRQDLAVFLTADHASWERPALLALVAEAAETDGSLHTALLVTTTPAAAGRVRISLNRTSGRTMYAGYGEVDGSGLRFTLSAVRGPGATETTVSGRVVDGTVQDLRITTGARLPRRQPVRLDG